MAVRGLLEAEVEKLQTQLGRLEKGKKKSIWDMNKDQLVEEAKDILGWDYVTADNQTVGQLRYFLRQANAENQPKKLIPTSINRMKKEALQVECVERDIPIHSDGKDLTREALIRSLLEWEGIKLLTAEEPGPSNVRQTPIARGSTARSRVTATAKGRPILAGIQPQSGTHPVSVKPLAAILEAVPTTIPENAAVENMAVDQQAEEHQSARRALVRS